MNYNKVILEYFWNVKKELNNEISDLENYSKRTDLVLLKRHLITEEELLKYYLKNTKYNKYHENILSENKSYIEIPVTSRFISKYKILPLARSSRKLTVLTYDPYAIKGFNLLKKYFNAVLDVYLVTKNEFQRLIKRYLNKEIFASDAEDDILATVAKQLDNILVKAITTRASDIHFEPNFKDVEVRLRIDGILCNYINLSNLIYSKLASKVKVLSEMDVSKTRIPQDGSFTYAYKRNDYDLRVSTMPTIYGEKVVIRLLNNKNEIGEFKELNFNSDIQALLLTHLKYGEGLIIISGPTGSGKTTTLYNMINEINKSEESIVTIEDPIEYKIDGISQIPVYGNTQIDFKTAMKYILRQDPNVILIGEIRDEDTAKMVQRISLTGHIILTSIHAQSISSAIRRICELGCDYKMIIESLNFVTNQRLIRKLCPYCKKTHYTTEDENEFLSINESIVIYDSIGCDKCNQTGFIGRIAVHEVAIFDNESKTKLLKGGDIEDVIDHIDDKMKSTIYDEALNLVKKGKTTITELKRLGIFK